MTKLYRIGIIEISQTGIIRKKGGVFELNNVIKTINFLKNDRELVELIEKYQKSKGIKSFVGAVRELCKDALMLKKISK